MVFQDFLYNSIVSGANSVVGAWNWTTGRGKESLSNSLFVLSNVFRQSKKPSDLLIDMTLVVLGIGLNRYIGNLEEMQRINPEVVIPQLECMKRAYFFGILGGTYVEILKCAINSKRSHKNEYLEDNNELDYLARVCYYSAMGVMLAEDRPIRKDCIRRGLDKLSEIVKNYSPNPHVRPA
ncbi:MAG: hypothetical protein AABX88_02945 [Nanoarchaeota archaeon]